ncbi:hypothetical protein M3210_02905 [Oceanobacillus luteolus]|uniref:hypothetical protein n=1 Tax=Oceanobacillus luteolus TaxID=1274358 RepID=UPI002040BD05|nr:hypothetical protein [Oceanobacillus luteolus]MCM3739212.1 hypothetical protein [Oceanobacillus luteolus]
MVYIVQTEVDGILSVCKDEQTAAWEKNLFEANGFQNIEIKECSVISYDKEFYDKQVETIQREWGVID